MFIHKKKDPALKIVLIITLFIISILIMFTNFSKEDDNVSVNIEVIMAKYVKVLYKELNEVTIVCDQIGNVDRYHRCIATGKFEDNIRVTIIAKCNGTGNCIPIQ